MDGREMKTSGARSDLPQAVIDLAQHDQAALEGEAPGTGAEVELALADLVSDANGEVVVFNDSGSRTLAIRTASTVVAEGRASKHVTAGGEDVSGYRYVTFANGVTLYYPDGIDLMVSGEGSRPAR
jgi:hypothetical protein